MSVGIQIELRGFAKVQRQLLKLSSIDMSALLDGVGQMVENQVKNRILHEKTSPDGTKWAPLSTEYAAWKTEKKGGGVGLLQFDGHLNKSIQHIVSGDEVEFGSNLDYAAAHQYGHKGTPARPYLGLSDQNEDDIEELVTDYLRDLIK